jgi:hypothetical protein
MSVKPPRRRWLRWLRRTLLAIGLLLGIAIALAVWLVRNLNTGWVKQRLRAITGVALDYSDAKLRILSGIHLSDLRVASPEKWRALAPAVVQVGGLDLGWSLFGKHETLRTVIAEDVEITVVIDEQHHTSLEGLREGGAEEPEGPPEPPLTPGHTLAHLMEALPEFDHVALRRARVTVLRTDGGRVVEELRLGGFDLDARSTGTARQHVKLAIGGKHHPDELTIARRLEGSAAGDAAGSLWLAAELDADGAEVHGELAYHRQSLSPEWPKKATLFAVDAQARVEHDRLAVQLGRLELVDQAFTAHGAIDVDDGRAHVIVAQGKIDLDRLVRLLPKGLIPLELREGRARYDVALLELSTTPSLDPKGRLELDGVLAGVRLQGSTALSLDTAKLEVRGKPAANGGLHLTVELPAGALHVEAGGLRGDLRGVHLAATGTFAPGMPGRAEARLRFDQLAGDGPPGQLAATAGNLSLELGELTVASWKTRDFDAAVRLETSLGTVDARRPELRAHASEVGLTAHTRVTHGAPGPLELTVPLGAVEVVNGSETVLPSGPAKLAARIDRVRFDRAAPKRSLVDGRIDATVGPITLGATFQKQAAALDFDLALAAQKTALLTAFAPAKLALPGARMAAKLACKGRLEGPKLRAQATLHVDKPGATVAGDRLEAAQLDATVAIDGTLEKQALAFTLDPQALELDGDALGSGHLAAKVGWDLSRPSITLRLEGRGEALPEGNLTLTGELDGKSRALVYQIDGELGHLAAIDPLLPDFLNDDHWLDLSALRVRVRSHGSLTGLLRAAARRVPELEPHPLQTLAGDGDLELELEHAHYVDARGVELTVPSLGLSGSVHGAGEHRKAVVVATIAQAALIAGAHRLDLSGLREKVELTANGDPRSGELDATHAFTLDKLEQDWLPVYPVARVAWSGHARRGADGTLHVDDVLFTNEGGGTHLKLSGALILPRTLSLKPAAAGAIPLVGFRSMTLSAKLDQRLDRLTGDPKHFRGAGAIELTAEVASGDLRRFHLVSSTRLRKATIELPEKQLALVGLEGTLPLAEDVRVDHGKISFAEVHDTNVYPTLRFSDQHPFLSGSGGLTAEKITAGNLTLARVAGNLRLQRNLFAIDQLEAETRGGRLSGQCLLVMKGPRSTVDARLRLSGIEALHGGTKERFDGNAALLFSVADRTLEGRAEILRIGRNHLFDLLDDYDPQHLDAATNRVRKALAIGYPDRLRVLFERGFASFSITFGGLGKLIRIEDVHGIPTGPLVDRYLGPLFALEDAP